MVDQSPAASRAATRAEHGTPPGDVREFCKQNETLVKVASLVFAAAAFLRASPKDDAVAILMFLPIVLGVVIYARRRALWVHARWSPR
jgi:hypothetical protein